MKQTTVRAGVLAVLAALGVATSSLVSEAPAARAEAAAAPPGVTYVNLTAADRATLLSEFATAHPAASVLKSAVAVDDAATATEWAFARFTPPTMTAAVSLQDGASTGVFERSQNGQWDFLGVGGEPVGCTMTIPAAVRTAWGLTPCTSSAPLAQVSQLGTAQPGAVATSQAATGTAAGVASIAESQVGVADNPAETNFKGLDCNPYTALVGVTWATQTGCNVNAKFNIRNRSEFWCADFAKWVWGQAGVANTGLLTPAASSFYGWGQSNGDWLQVDGSNPQVGDAVVFFPSGGAVGGSAYADHVGIVTGVNSDGTVNLVNGDFAGPTNIRVEADNYVRIGSWAAGIWGPGEQWVYVSPRLTPAAPPPPSGVAAETDGGTHRLYGPHQTGGMVQDVGGSSWSGWQQLKILGGTLKNAPAVSYSNGRYDLYAVNASGQAVHSTYITGHSSGWSAWQNLGGQFLGGVTAETDHGIFRVYGVGLDGRVYLDQGTGNSWWGWSAQHNPPTRLAQTPAISYNNGRYDLYAVGTDGAVRHTVYVSGSSGWSAWQDLGGQLVGGVAAEADNGFTRAYGVGLNGRLYQAQAAGGGWSGWTQLPTPSAVLQGTPAVTYDGGGRYDAFGVARNGQVLQTTYVGGSTGWRAWQNLGGDLG